MVENQHRLIKGYADLDQRTVDAINSIKDLQEDIANLWFQVSEDHDVDFRWMNIAKTHFEEGCAAFVKAVAKGESPFNR